MARDLAIRQRGGHSVHGVLLGDVERLLLGGHPDAADGGAATWCVAERKDPNVLGAGEHAYGLGGVIDNLEPRRFWRRLKSQAGLYWDLVGRREPAEELPELHAVEHGARLVVVVSRPSRGFEIEVDGHVADDRDHPFAESDLVGVRFEGCFEPALRQLLDPFEQSLDGAEVLHQLGRGLVAHPGDAWNVV